jgi:fused signal recognition particle receptor
MRTFGEAPPPPTFFDRLKSGLSKTGLGEILTKKKLDAAAVAKNRYDAEISGAELKAVLAAEIAALLTPIQQPLRVEDGKKPFVILVAGVNGTGKTTTIGKLAKRLAEEGAKVTLAAGDTFRAAAIEQLRVWADRAGVPVVERERGTDPASVVFDTLAEARKTSADLVLVDTAGRLHTSADLMQELRKVQRVAKAQSTSPVVSLLVLDASTGQNGLQQARSFNDALDLDGIVLTKLDGTARGGIAVAIARELSLPIVRIGVGESLDDLHAFDATEFASALTGAR